MTLSLQSDPSRAEDASLRAKLQRAVGRALPGWARSHEEDIVQAAMLRVVKARETREGDWPVPASYLWKVAYTTTIDALRQLRARPDLRAGGVALDEGSEPAAPHRSPERRALAAEISAGIQGCLASLSDDRKQAVALYLQGHTVPETGRLLGWPAKRAENMVYRGLADLRRCLSGRGLEP